MNLHELSILQIQELIATGKISPADVFAHFKKRAEELNPKLNAFATIAETPAVFSGK